jgi:ribosomal protein S18 acetylase RimI-like enzyme
VVAVDGAELVGFIQTVHGEDPAWGAHVDNLHVSHGRQRRGIGALLLATSIESAREQGTGLYLWVQEQNNRAQSFYEAQGGSRVERAPIDPPGGIPERLSGTPMKLRYAWT